MCYHMADINGNGETLAKVEQFAKVLPIKYIYIYIYIYHKTADGIKIHCDIWIQSI